MGRNNPATVATRERDGSLVTYGLVRLEVGSGRLPGALPITVAAECVIDRKTHSEKCGIAMPVRNVHVTIGSGWNESGRVWFTIEATVNVPNSSAVLTSQ
jgi:hypothetical protein